MDNGLVILVSLVWGLWPYMVEICPRYLLLMMIQGAVVQYLNHQVPNLRYQVPDPHRRGLDPHRRGLDPHHEALVQQMRVIDGVKMLN